MIEVRPARGEDVPAVARVHAKADWETYAPLFGARAYALDVATLEQRWERALSEGGLVFFATNGDDILGLAHAHADRIEALYLLAAYRRRGIGKMLLSELLRGLNGRGIAEVHLDVIAINADAIAFYRAQGAREVGRRVNHDSRGDVEDLLFVIATAPMCHQNSN
ncbi:MAG: GNAT family N-acetyltransferase [Xanthobacteraceae bacterium]